MIATLWTVTHPFPFLISSDWFISPGLFVCIFCFSSISLEEWIKKRKVEQVTTKQIETRVKRQVVVTEDGQVVDDSGPQVTTRTTEDTETKREEHTEVSRDFFFRD